MPIAIAIPMMLVAILAVSFPAIFDMRIISASKTKNFCMTWMPLLTSAGSSFASIFRTPAIISMENDIDATVPPNFPASLPAILLAIPISTNMRLNASITTMPFITSSGFSLRIIFITKTMIPRETASFINVEPLSYCPAARLAHPS